MSACIASGVHYLAVTAKTGCIHLPSHYPSAPLLLLVSCCCPVWAGTSCRVIAGASCCSESRLATEPAHCIPGRRYDVARLCRMRRFKVVSEIAEGTGSDLPIRPIWNFFHHRKLKNDVLVDLTPVACWKLGGSGRARRRAGAAGREAGAGVVFQVGKTGHVGHGRAGCMLEARRHSLCSKKHAQAVIFGDATIDDTNAIKWDALDHETFRRFSDAPRRHSPHRGSAPGMQSAGIRLGRSGM